MKIDVTTEGFQKKLAFVVPADQVRGELDEAFRKLSRTARLRGFRPGKAPRRVLEAHFGPQVRADVANNLIQSSWMQALSTQDIEPVGNPSIEHADELDGRNDFHFTIRVEVRPEVELEQYTGVEVPYPEARVTDEELEAMVHARLEGQARLVEVTDRPVEQGDLVLAELVVGPEDAPVATEQGTAIRTDGDPYYPGVEGLLLGMSIGEEKTGEVSFPEDARTEEIQGQTLPVRAKVLGIQATRIPELDDEIAEELGFEGGAEGMRTALRAQMQAARDELSRNQARANLLEKLIEINPFEVPEGMVEQSLQMLSDELKMQEAYRTGRDPQTIGFSDATMADLRNRARFAAKAGLILESVSRKEKIEVNDDDIEKRLQELADMRGQTVEAIRGWFSTDEAIAELRDRILEEKTLEWLLEHSTLVPAEPARPTSELGRVAQDIVESNVARRAQKTSADKAAEAPATEEPAPKAEEAPAETAAAEVDTSVLDQPIGKLKDALATGAWDDHLDALEAAEKSGKNRKGALDAIAGRRS